MHPMVIALLSITLSVAAQFSLKAGMRVHAGPSWMALLQPMVMLGFVLYGFGAVVWLSVLARWDVSKAYPLVGIGFVMTAAVGYLLGEQLNVQRLFGIALICLGVILVSRT